MPVQLPFDCPRGTEARPDSISDAGQVFFGDFDTPLSFRQWTNDVLDAANYPNANENWTYDETNGWRVNLEGLIRDYGAPEYPGTVELWTQDITDFCGQPPPTAEEVFQSPRFPNYWDESMGRNIAEVTALLLLSRWFENCECRAFEDCEYWEGRGQCRIPYQLTVAWETQRIPNPGQDPPPWQGHTFSLSAVGAYPNSSGLHGPVGVPYLCGSVPFGKCAFKLTFILPIQIPELIKSLMLITLMFGEFAILELYYFNQFILFNKITVVSNLPQQLRFPPSRLDGSVIPVKTAIVDRRTTA